MSDMKRSFAQRGAFVEVSTTVEKEKLDSKAVLNMLRNFDAEIGKIQGNYGQLETQKADLDKGIAHYTELRKQVSKYEEWALNIQESKVKALMAEVIDECAKSVRDAYTPDATLTKEQNGLQMLSQLQQKMATHPKVASELDQEIVKKHFFVKSAIVNPFN
jgi:hypothetical protein